MFEGLHIKTDLKRNKVRNVVRKELPYVLTNDLVSDAVNFHGHFGPFLILGLRAGLTGITYLGKNYFELKATVATTLHPPRSCFIDGIQFVSGCTTGKGNLEIKASEDVSVSFTRAERKISLTIRDTILKILDQSMSEEQLEIFGKEILQKTDDELFLINKD